MKNYIRLEYVFITDLNGVPREIVNNLCVDISLVETYQSGEINKMYKDYCLITLNKKIQCLINDGDGLPRKFILGDIFLTNRYSFNEALGRDKGKQ